MIGFAGFYVPGKGGLSGEGFVGYLTRGPAGVEAIRALVADDGPDAIAALRGAFSLAVWDAGSRRGVLATDHLGAGGLFYRAEPRRLVYASEIHLLLELLDTTPPPDEDALVRWLAFDAAAPGQTLYEGIRRLNAGELIELGADSYRVRTYWQPCYVGSTNRTLDEHVDAVAAEAVQARLDRSGPTGVLLSGGLDSSSVVAFAGSRSANGLRGYSAVFPAHPEMDESALIEQVAAAFALPVTTLAVNGGSMVAAALGFLAKWRLPSESPNLLFLAPLAEIAAHDGIGVLLDGEGGDELFGGSPYVFADLIKAGRLRRALQVADQIPGVKEKPRTKVLRWIAREWGVKGLMPHGAHSLLRRVRPSHYGAPWLTPPAAVQHGRSVDPWQWKRLDGPRSWANLAFDFTQGRVQLRAHDFLRRKSEAAGVQGRHPYLDDVDLIAELLSIPSDVSYDARFDRPLLRRAVAGVVPDAVRLRPEKSYFNALFEEVLTSTDRGPLLELLGENARIGRYVRVGALRGWLLDPAGRPATWRWIVWRAAMAECWLRTLEDSSFPGRAAHEWRVEQPDLVFRRAQAPQ
jgi:asparagine synthase (glutamine-hydrolysing)